MILKVIVYVSAGLVYSSVLIKGAFSFHIFVVASGETTCPRESGRTLTLGNPERRGCSIFTKVTISCANPIGKRKKYGR
jgi:hypothetical protein